MPGDGDVDEPLEEVALVSLGGAPLRLEGLVRLEPLAATHELETVRERHLARLRGRTTPVATILLVGVDLFFRSKLEGLLPTHKLVTRDSVDPPDLVICDLTRIEAEDVADAWPEVPILVFTNHTDTLGLQRAHAAGFDQVIVKSALIERAGLLVDELVGTTA
jgi:CheY-like chemotaxis protein